MHGNVTCGEYDVCDGDVWGIRCMGMSHVGNMMHAPSYAWRHFVLVRAPITENALGSCPVLYMMPFSQLLGHPPPDKIYQSIYPLFVAICRAAPIKPAR